MWDVGEDIATCPSCTLTIRIIYEEEDLPDLREDSDDEDNDGNNTEQEGDSINIKVDEDVKNTSENVDKPSISVK
jgi:hypothetical protein